MTDSPRRGDLDAVFFERFFSRLAASGVPASSRWRNAVWRVDELPGGRWAVAPEGEPDGDPSPRWELDDRRQAYLTAACLTAYAALEAPSGSAGGGGGDELREAAAGGERRTAVVSRILQGLVASPAAIELVLEAADPEVAAEAKRLAAERLERGEVN